MKSGYTVPNPVLEKDYTHTYREPTEQRGGIFSGSFHHWKMICRFIMRP